MRELTYAQAIREALRFELARDERVFLLGEDIGCYGGTFKVTEGLQAEFGPERVMETPISEAGFIGLAVGAAATGLRPVAELMFSDFISVCYDQLANQAAKLRYMTGGQLSIPLVVRMAAGGGTGAAAQHSQSPEALLAHIPGLKVAIPSTPMDAKGLLLTAIRDEDPVMFLEQKLLYKEKGPVPEGDCAIPFGSAAVKREGSDASVITYGRTVGMAFSVANRLSGRVSVEVLDLRTLVPLDRGAILKSVRKTGRVLVLHEAVAFAGFGGEIAGVIAESDAFYCLKAPIRRLGAEFCPLPFSKGLEARALPDEGRIEEAILSLLRQKSELKSE